MNEASSRDCAGCGHPNPSDEQICHHCGQPLDWMSAALRPRPWSGRQTIGVGVLIGLGIGWLQWRPVPEVPFRAISERPQMDVVFAIDCTGSMGDELDVLKHETHTIVERLEHSKSSPALRIGLVAYKDHGDEYVTRVQPLTTNLAAVVDSLGQLQAGGGGDTPEAVDEGLHAAVEELNWDNDPKTTRLLFLIGDAGSHPSSRYDPLAEAKLAGERRIKILSIGCSGIESCGEQEFRDVATMSGGQFDYITYRQPGHKGEPTVLYQGPQSFALHREDAESKWKAGGDKVSHLFGGRSVESLHREIPDGGTGLDNNLDQLIGDRILLESEAARRRL